MATFIFILLVVSSMTLSDGYLVEEGKGHLDIQHLFYKDPLMEDGSMKMTGRAGILDSDRCNFNLKSILFWLGLKALALTIWFLRPREKYKPEYDYQDSSYGGGYGLRGSRSFDAGHGLFLSSSEEEGGRCFMLYTPGDAKRLTCMKRLACQDPNLALDYVEAARMVNMANKFSR